MGKRYNAFEVTYDEVKLFSRTALFSNDRIDKSTVPEGYFMYEIRHDDEGFNNPVQIGKSIAVNHFGTIITNERIILDPDGFRDMDIDALNFIGGKSLKDFMNMKRSANKKMQKIIVKDNLQNKLFFYDATCWEDYYEEYGYYFGRFKVVGVALPIKKVLRCDSKSLAENLIAVRKNLEDNVLYTVFLYNKNECLTGDVDTARTKKDIIDNFILNRYDFITEIFETENLLSGTTYYKKYKTMEFYNLVFYPHRDLSSDECKNFKMNLQNKKRCDFFPVNWCMKDFIKVAVESDSKVDLYKVNDTIVMPCSKGLYIYDEKVANG